MQLQATLPESKFPNEYRGVTFIQTVSTFEKVIAKIQRGHDFMKHGVVLLCCCCYYYKSLFTNWSHSNLSLLLQNTTFHHMEFIIVLCYYQI